MIAKTLDIMVSGISSLLPDGNGWILLDDKSDGFVAIHPTGELVSNSKCRVLFNTEHNYHIRFEKNKIVYHVDCKGKLILDPENGICWENAHGKFGDFKLRIISSKDDEVVPILAGITNGIVIVNIATKEFLSFQVDEKIKDVAFSSYGTTILCLTQTKKHSKVYILDNPLYE